MVGEVAARELVAEFEGQEKGHKAHLLSWLGLGPSEDVRDALGYRLGRNARSVTRHILEAKVAAVSEEITQYIYGLKEQKARLESHQWGAQSGLVLGIIFGVTILIAALYVDYKIIHEFWTRAIADEFGKVPRSLASSVTFKSAQVVFATLAFHLMLETVGDFWRKAFALFIFVLTFIMLLGIGLIIANKWLPPGSELFGIDLHAAVSSGEDILAALGLPSQVSSGTGPIGVEDVRTTQTLVWLGSLSLIFIIVTGVGSMCLRNAIHNFRVLIGTEVGGPASGGSARRGSRTERVAEIKVRLERFGIVFTSSDKKVADEHRAEEVRARLGVIRRHLLDFANSYATGLRDFQVAPFGPSRTVREERALALAEEFAGTMQQVMEALPELIAHHTVVRGDSEPKPQPKAKEPTGPKRNLGVIDGGKGTGTYDD